MHFSLATLVLLQFVNDNEEICLLGARYFYCFAPSEERYEHLRAFKQLDVEISRLPINPLKSLINRWSH